MVCYSLDFLNQCWETPLYFNIQRQCQHWMHEWLLFLVACFFSFLLFLLLIIFSNKDGCWFPPFFPRERERERERERAVGVGGTVCSQQREEADVGVWIGLLYFNAYVFFSPSIDIGLCHHFIHISLKIAIYWSLIFLWIDLGLQRLLSWFLDWISSCSKDSVKSYTRIWIEFKHSSSKTML